MTRVEMIKAKIMETDKKLRSLKEELREAHRRSYLTCNNCGEKSQVGRYMLVDYEWYDENTGSPCGGFYRHGEFFALCPKCETSKKNRLDEGLAYEMMYSFNGKITERESRDRWSRLL